MKIYFAGSEPKAYLNILKRLGVKNYLVSYYTLGLEGKPEKWDRIKEGYKGCSLFMDCGAYSAWKKGLELDVHKYAHFLLQAKDISIYPNLDVKGDPDRTKENQKILEDYGLRPLPVFHLNTKHWDTLEEYIEKYDYIALGAMAGEKTGSLENNLNQVFQRAKKNPLTKFHGFGVTTPKIMRKYPFYSVDSTSWLAPAAWGGISEFKKGEVKQKKDEFSVYRNRKHNHKRIVELSAMEYLKLEAYITDIWTKKGIIWQ